MKRKTIGKVAAAAAVVLAVCVAAVWVYASDYYRGDAVAAAALEDELCVSVSEGVVVFSPEEEPVAGFIFYPGGKVEYTAYAPLMRMLAEEGILCLIPEMPLNLAVLDIHAAEELRDRYEAVDRWYIGGHSLGGSMAASHAAEHAEDYEGLVLLASYSTADLRGTDLEVLSLYGSEDGVLNMEKYTEYHANLPQDTVEAVVAGGNHAQFGSYGPQDGDGEATVTAKEQLEQTVLAIMNVIER